MKYYSSFDTTVENFLNSRALNYGDGVFETMLVNDNIIRLFDLHMMRLQSSLKVLNLQPLNIKSIFDNAMSLIKDKNCYVLKLVAFRDDSQRGYSSQSIKAHYFLTLNPYAKGKISDKLTKSSVMLSSQKKLAGIKHLNRLEQVLASQALNHTEFSDAIMCNENGRIIETISKNIVLFKQDKIYSPKLSKSGVFGVALRWLQVQGHEINWKKIEFKDLPKYHGMMTCNSIQGFKAIKNIDNKIHFNKDLKIIKLIQSQWNDLC